MALQVQDAANTEAERVAACLVARMFSSAALPMLTPMVLQVQDAARTEVQCAAAHQAASRMLNAALPRLTPMALQGQDAASTADTDGKGGRTRSLMIHLQVQDA